LPICSGFMVSVGPHTKLLGDGLFIDRLRLLETLCNVNCRSVQNSVKQWRGSVTHRFVDCLVSTSWPVETVWIWSYVRWTVPSWRCAIYTKTKGIRSKNRSRVHRDKSFPYSVTRSRTQDPSSGRRGPRKKPVLIWLFNFIYEFSLSCSHVSLNAHHVQTYACSHNTSRETYALSKISQTDPSLSQNWRI
jgi:hypothetical protein